MFCGLKEQRRPISRLKLVKPRSGMLTLGLIALVLGSVSCGEEPLGTGTQRGEGASLAEEPPEDQIYEATGLVLDDGEELVLCVGSVADSLPPQCGGPELRGWSWDGLEFDEAGGTRWGRFTVRGTYVDGVFTLKGQPVEPEPFEGDGDPIDAPCPEPDGGWAIPDPDRTEERHRLAATRQAEDQSDFAGAWIDYIVEPTDEEEMQPWGENIVLVLAFTGDPERHETEAREHWGGALCVWVKDRTEEELETIQDELSDGWPEEEFGIETTFSSIDITAGTVELGVVVSTPAFEAELEDRYGSLAVVLRPALHPVD